MKHSEYSVLIVGSGAAGLYAALKLSSQISLPDGVLLITKSTLGESNSRYAQGGIVGVVHQNVGDSVEKHLSDTLKAGAGLSDENVTKYISEISDEVINNLINCGVDFDRNSKGELNFTLEAAHSFRRILHVGGDATGKGIIEALKKRVLEDSNITVVENSMAVELLINADSECKGIILYNELTNEHEIVYSSATILATGGLAAVPIALACGSSFLGGAAGNIAGEQTQSLLTDGKLKSVDSNMLKRSAAAGAVNVAAMGASGLLKYADEGRATFGNGKKFATNLKNSFSNNMSIIDATSAFITTHLAFDGYAISLFWEN